MKCTNPSSCTIPKACGTRGNNHPLSRQLCTHRLVGVTSRPKIDENRRKLPLHCVAATPSEGPSSNEASSSSQRIKLWDNFKKWMGYEDEDKANAASPSTSTPSSCTTSTPSTLARSNETTSTDFIAGSWDWWEAYFNALDDTVHELEGLDEELAAAVAEEDYGKAAALRKHQKRLQAANTIDTVMEELDAAIKEERYGNAAALRDGGGVGLMGWWAGQAERDDPSGHLIHITSDFGRYVATSYTGHQLAQLLGWQEETGVQIVRFNGPNDPDGTITIDEDTDISPSEIGDPVFEVFLRKDPDTGAYIQQPSVLHAPASAFAPPPQMLENLSEMLMADGGVRDGYRLSVQQSMDERDGVDLTVRIIHQTELDDEDEDPDSEEEEEQGVVENLNMIDDSAEEDPNAPPGQKAWMEVDGKLRQVSLSELGLGIQEQQSIVEEDSLAGDTISSMGLGVVAQRVPAEITWMNRDSFTLVVQGSAAKNEEETIVSTKNSEEEEEEENFERTKTISEVSVPTAFKKDAKKGISDWNDLMVRQALGQAIAQGMGVNMQGNDDGMVGLHGRVTYTRIPIDDAKTDPFSGNYLGQFGPHGPEVVRLRRCMVEGEECVEGIKLTGDPNVPVGKVTFRAKIGRQHRLSPGDEYPPELGIIHRYKGKGRVAREGYSAAKWVDGELLTLAASSPLAKGNDSIGFLYSIDNTRRFLLLFSRLDLDTLKVEDADD